MNAAVMTPSPVTPWYRQRWPWLLMLMPAIALFGGLYTAYLAVTTNDALVVDDYYREGKAINLQIARDVRAAELGLSASLSSGIGGGLTVRLQSNPGVALPDALSLRIMHATRAELDRQTVLPAMGGGVYARPEFDLPRDGRWRVQIESADKAWRLVGTASAGFERPFELKADAPAVRGEAPVAAPSPAVPDSAGGAAPASR